MTKYVASCSFGKDSLAMLIKIKELGLPLDEVIYVDLINKCGTIRRKLIASVTTAKSKKE